MVFLTCLSNIIFWFFVAFSVAKTLSLTKNKTTFGSFGSVKDL